MAFLTVDGIDVPVASEGASFPERLRIGTFSRSFDGSGRSTIRAAKQGIKVQTTFMDDTKLAALRAVHDAGAIVSITGDIGGYSAFVTLADVTVQWIRGARAWRALLSIEEA